MLLVSFKKVNGLWSTERRPYNPKGLSDKQLIAAYQRLNKFSEKVSWRYA